MVCIRFISLVLGLLFLLNALRYYSCAHAHQQDWEKDKDKLVVPEDIASADKELVDGFTTTSTRKLGLGGRKVVTHEVLMRRNFEKELSTSNGGASEDISGEQSHAVVKSLQVSEDQFLNFNHQNMNSLKPKAQNSGSWGSPRSEPEPEPEPEPVHFPNTKPRHSHQDSKKLPTKALESLSRSENKLFSHQPQAQATVPKPKGETQRLLEATKDIVNLMNKDYKGMDRPRRKPPINNHVPTH
ncbi:uncharacterized protein LOC110659568 isoform X2 [Hevea brasiliensis]|uniref:uncharacterized protein LOC110659568 isoform X2 n=1 Tax=Hevea brasiliensis TaxID=3981 RepID=UPI0025F548E7|nr:uncharacterized protein LOC110659568 isoform X2 [Hevea brasiliensis]